MENSDKKQLTPRDPEYYKGRYPDRLEPPEKSLADEVASAIAEDLYRKESEKNPPKFPAIFLPPKDQSVAQKCVEKSKEYDINKMVFKEIETYKAVLGCQNQK